jgi:hypothetical protein
MNTFPKRRSGGNLSSYFLVDLVFVLISVFSCLILDYNTPEKYFVFVYFPFVKCHNWYIKINMSSSAS